MTHRRVLLIVGAEIGAEEVDEAVGDLGAESEVQVVAPATNISRLDWLTNAEDDARAEAAERAEAAASAVPSAQVDSVVGDTDPLVAIDDAVRTFDPDEIVILSKPDDASPWLETGTADSARDRFAVPVRHLVVR